LRVQVHRQVSAESVQPVSDEERSKLVEQLLETPGLADALESDRFKQFLDHVPIAIAVSKTGGDECVIYVNLEFERLCGLSAADVVDRSWDVLDAHTDGGDAQHPLSEVITREQEYLGAFRFRGQTSVLDAWANVIEDDDGVPTFRLVAMAAVQSEIATERAQTARQLEEKDTLLRELQHRVKNNLQMITALIRLEARQLPVEWKLCRYSISLCPSRRMSRRSISASISVKWLQRSCGRMA
jgi:PAS domain S-box-containing protein